MGQAIYISEDAFVAIFKPLPNPLDTYTSFDWGDGVGTLYETIGSELEFVQTQDPSHVWTLVDCDGSLCIISGIHVINRLGYFVTERPVADDMDIEVVLDDDLPPLHATERASLIEVLNHLADEELSYETCDDSEKEYHIWHHCLTLRQLIEP